MSSYLKEKYKSEIIPDLKKEFEISNLFKVPQLVKISLNIGAGLAATDHKLLDSLLSDLTLIAGQKAVSTRAKVAIAGFKIRENVPLGCRVTLRGDRMYDFLHKLVTIVIPKVRDFRGLSSKSFDGGFNYNMGLEDYTLFPEVNPDRVYRICGLNITFVIKSSSKEHSYALLKKLGMPLREL